MQIILLFVLVTTGFWQVDIALGDVRCFCNMPQCITTAYMCKSTSPDRGGCFTDLTDEDELRLAKFGCVDLLPSDEQTECRPFKDDKSETVGFQAMMLFCCHRDMCNHMESIEMRELINLTSPSIPKVNVNPDTDRVYYEPDVWLKAATIAVPICGGFIVVILVILAVKILRKDSKRMAQAPTRGYSPCHNGSSRASNQPSKMKLLVMDDTYDKNVIHAKLNCNNCSVRKNNIYTDKTEQPLCNKNVINWGNNDKDSASPV